MMVDGRSMASPTGTCGHYRFADAPCFDWSRFMKSCVAACDPETDLQLAFVTGLELYQKLRTMTERMFAGRQIPTGTGTSQQPYIIDSFKKILGYIYLRDEHRAGQLHFKFFGTDMTQNGNEDAAGTQKYYIALAGAESLSYPAMGKAISSAQPSPGTPGGTVKSAVGTAPANATEMLAIAALFIAEGRRSRPSIITHLMLCDLISDQIKYGRTGKVRTLLNAIDKPIKQKGNVYLGMTNLGDSPMAQNEAVDQANKTNNSSETGSLMAKTRYFDKTVSLCAQWVAAYYESEKFILKACSPADDAGAIDAANVNKMSKHIEAKKEVLRTTLKSTNSKSGFENKWPRQRNSLEASEWKKFNGVKPLVLSQIQNMLASKLDKALAGEASGFTFATDDVGFDTKALVAVLNAT
jgi:hypothetical protein